MSANIKIGKDTLQGVNAVELENADALGSYVKFTLGISGGYTVTFVAEGNPTWEIRFDDGTYTSESGTHTSSGRSVVVTVYGGGNPSISGATIFYGNDYHEMAIVGHEASGIVPEGYDTARISVVVSA